MHPLIKRSRFFPDLSGILITKLKSLPGETSVVVSDYLSDCLTENGSVGKAVGLCADNTNSNFGGAERKGQNNVFTKPQKNLMHGLIGVGVLATSSATLFEQLPIFCLLM
jgi:hypothetical protein